jgi:hypothetical protein
MQYCVYSAALVCSGGWKMAQDGCCVACGYLLMEKIM